MRPLVKKFIKTKTTPTNLDMQIGKQFKLLEDIKEGRSQIKIHDIIWTVSCEDNLKKGDTVEVQGMEGNKYIVGKPTPINTDINNNININKNGGTKK